jgi:hypothetical protein
MKEWSEFNHHYPYPHRKAMLDGMKSTAAVHDLQQSAFACEEPRPNHELQTALQDAPPANVSRVSISAPLVELPPIALRSDRSTDVAALKEGT